MDEQFPPLPAMVLEMDDVTAYDVAEANFKLALDFAKAFAAKSNTDKSSSDSEEKSDNIKLPNNVAILFPDEAEMRITLENTSTTLNPFPGVQISSLRISDEMKQLFN